MKKYEKIALDGNIKDVIIYGYSKLGKEIASQFNSKDMGVVFLDREKQSTKDIIYDPNSFDWGNNSSPRKYIIASYNYMDEMLEFLLKRGINKDDIIIPNSVLMHQLNKKNELLKKRTPKDFVSIVFCIVEHCNLNCAYCDHFSPLSKKWFMDLATFKNDLIRMKEICGERIHTVKIEGGEPLLHKEVTSFLRIAREIAANANIELLTNGLLLKAMKDDFWECCRENRILLKVTKYPISLDYTYLKKLATKRGVGLCIPNGELSEKKMRKYAIDLLGNQSRYKSFELCSMANGECMQVHEGKLYQCTKIPCLKIFCDFFDYNIVLKERDYLNIYSDISFDDIQDYLCNPVPVCRYCINYDFGEYEWSVSKRNISEWV